MALCGPPALAGGPAGPASANGALSPRDLALYRAAFKAVDEDRWTDARRLAAEAEERIPGKVILWLDLQRPDSGADWSSLVTFIRQNPDWPGLTALRRQAESALPPNLPRAEALAWFTEYPPLTTAGVARFAGVLMEGGESDRATALVRDRWIAGSFVPSEEKDFRQQFRSILRPADHEARLDRLLWGGDEEAARRMLPLVDRGHQALAEARLALAALAPGVDGALRHVPMELRDDPGLTFERVRWRRRKGLDDDAIALLAKQPPAVERPVAWWTERSILARRAIEAGNYALAYRLAKSHGLTDDATASQAEWLAGWVALRFLDKPADALQHFQQVYDHVTMPISRARGAYWAARAADALGKADVAHDWYKSASVHIGTFYGQLAAHAVDREAWVALPREPAIPAATAAAFERREIVRAARLLHQIDDQDRNGIFLRKIGAEAHTPAEYALATRLALDLDRTELAVRIAKQGVQDDVTLVEGAYPLLGTALPPQPEPALVHALIRQESTFNVGAVSAAGARGLMQLMPSTAEHVADALGVRRSEDRLTTNAAYNIQLGSAYFAELLDRFNGSYVLAIAAYNAGPARVHGWLDAFGDPRGQGIDVIDWIELIPIHETRNYVQRVLESLQVYRARLNDGAAALHLAEDLRR